MGIRIHKENIGKEDYELFVLGGDVGGTHTNIAVAGVKNDDITLLYSAHFESQKLDSLAPAVRQTLEYGRDKYGIKVERGCVGVAGAVTNCKSAKLTNIPWNVDAKKIKKDAELMEFHIINDFQIIGYGIDSLQEDDVYEAKKGASGLRETRAVIGAGTGLGKAVLVYDGKRYIPASSEGGHGDFPVHDEFDFELVEHIQGERKTPVSYEDVLSGRGIKRIYGFLNVKYGKTEYCKEIEDAKDKAALISKYRYKDKLCSETFRIYAKYYGRCAKNYVLDTLATGGLYIAGGIASKNRDIFVSPEFQEEFLNAEKQRHVLEKTPVYVITNYDVSLYGACNAALFGCGL